jgi:ligand-binding sensor domain-containing protein
LKASWLIYLIIILESFSGHSQNLNPYLSIQHQNISINEGLPSSETYYVHQDKQGYIWVCTDRGVVRFDGFNFELFNISNGLLDNVVFKIYEDETGKIWFISISGRLCYFQDNKITPYKYNSKIKELFYNYHNPTKDILINSKGELIITCRERGIYKISTSGTIEKLAQENYSIYILKSNNKTIISDQSQTILSKNYINPKINYKIYYSENESFQTPQGEDLIKSIIIDTSIAELFVYETEGETFYILNNQLFSTQEQEALLEVPDLLSVKAIDDLLLLGGLKTGLKIYQKINGYYINKFNFLENLSISHILQDHEGGIWITTLEKGLIYIPDLKHLEIVNFPKHSNNYVTDMTRNGNDIYFGFQGSNWIALPSLKGSFPINTSGSLNSKLFNFQGKVILSNNKGTNFIEGKKENQSVCGYWAKDYFIKNNSLYIANNYIFKYDSKQKVKTPINTSGQSYFESIMLDAKNEIYVSNLNGIFKIENNVIKPDYFKDSLFKVRVVDLEHNKYWGKIAATRGYGVFTWTNTKVNKIFNVNTGIVSNDINKLYVDHLNNLWILTNKGASFIQKGTLKTFNFTKKNGLISEECTSILIHNQTVYIGTKNGVSVFPYPKKISPDTTKKVILSSISCSDSTKKDFESFAFNEKIIRIKFRSLNYKTSQEPNFRYRLSKSNPWEETNVPEIILNYPSSNNYELEVKVQDENGHWSEPVLIAKFVVESPFYNRWYFYLLCSILILLITHFSFSYKLKKTKEKYRTQKLIKNLESKALRSQMNPHFIFNALNSIQSFLVFEENEKAEKYLIKFAYLIRQTLNNSRSTYITIENEMNILDRYLELEKMRFKSKFNYDISFNVPERYKSLYIPPMLIQPYIENSIIHAFKTLNHIGQIHITFQILSNKKAFCIIEDNGIGITNSTPNSKKENPSFGRTITEERLLIFSNNSTENYTVTTAESNPNSETPGTKITIEIPIFETNDEL